MTKRSIYTLSDFLTENTIPDIRLLTKPREFHNIVIEQASAQELPAQHFIHNDELVLTTALGCSDEASFLTLIHEMSHAAAVFLTFQNDAFPIPTSAIALADEYDLPLFIIPWKYRFSQIIEHISKRVQEKQLEVFQILQNGLFDLFFESRALEDATQFIENTWGYTVLITDKNKQHISSSGIIDKGQDICNETELPICINKKLCGYLVIFQTKLQEPIRIDPVLLQKYICFPLSLWFNKKDTENMLVTRLKNDFILNLANGNYDSFDDMAITGTRLHFDLNKPYTCIVFKAIPNASLTEENWYSNESAVNRTTIETFLIEEGKRQNIGVMVAAQNLEFITYVENLLDNADSHIDSFIDTADKILKQLLPTYSFYWGVSEISIKKPNFERLFKNATLALQHCLNSKQKRYRCSYLDTKEAYIISVLAKDSEIQQIVHDTIGSLQEYDAHSEINLMGTLLEFVKCNFNISKTARNLHIHRQSLLYRFEKIEELTETSLDNHQDLFLLETCVRILIGDNHY